MNLPNNRHADKCKACGGEPTICEYWPYFAVECTPCHWVAAGHTLDDALGLWNGPWPRRSFVVTPPPEAQP